MPGFFYHIKIELSSNPEHNTDAKPRAAGPFSESLRPFTCLVRNPRDCTLHQRSISRQVRLQGAGAGALTDSFEAQPKSPPTDHRFDHIQIGRVDIAPAMPEKKDSIVGKGIGSDISGQHMKGRYEALVSQEDEMQWGIVHLYRDSEETANLYKDSPLHLSDLWSDTARRKQENPYPAPRDEDCASLCILAVPSYMTPSDFLAWVGEDTRRKVTHFRMIRTERANRYMVLMKFKQGKTARIWQQEWNNKVFNDIEPETCHVVFLKSVELLQTTVDAQTGITGRNDGSSFPRMMNDPFVPAKATTKPPAPRTASLVELPLCPVCLERMDETSGLLTIPCQHVFHCTCLQKWSGGGCPVCRFTNDDFSSSAASYKRKVKVGGEYEVDEVPLECETCHETKQLWQCLVCGFVGCGRYAGKHAYSHFQETGHTFSMDLKEQRVWDYDGDSYVHRIIQNAEKPGEKLVELPGRGQQTTALQAVEDPEDVKMQNIALEYTQLLTSQLDSQRIYFEEKLEQAADKASKASRLADRAQAECADVRIKLKNVEQHELVAKGAIAQLEKDKLALEVRSKRVEQWWRDADTKYKDENKISKGLMERNKHLESTQAESYAKKIQELEDDIKTKDMLLEAAQEQVRDAMLQYKAAEQLQDMVARGEIDQEELEGAEVSVGSRPLTARERIKKNIADAKTARSVKPKPSLPPSAVPAAPNPGASFNALEMARDGFIDHLRSAGCLAQNGTSHEQTLKDAFDKMTLSLVEEGVLHIPEEHEDALQTQPGDSAGGKKAKGKGKGKKVP